MCGTRGQCQIGSGNRDQGTGSRNVYVYFYVYGRSGIGLDGMDIYVSIACMYACMYRRNRAQTQAQVQAQSDHHLSFGQGLDEKRRQEEKQIVENRKKETC